MYTSLPHFLNITTNKSIDKNKENKLYTINQNVISLLIFFLSDFALQPLLR